MPDLGITSEINVEVRDRSRRVQNWNLLDVRLQKLFPLGPETRLGLFFDALNLLNNGANENVVSRFGTSSGFEVPEDFLPPRRLQVGVKFQF